MQECHGKRHTSLAPKHDLGVAQKNCTEGSEGAGTMHEEGPPCLWRQQDQKARRANKIRERANRRRHLVSLGCCCSLPANDERLWVGHLGHLRQQDWGLQKGGGRGVGLLVSLGCHCCLPAERLWIGCLCHLQQQSQGCRRGRGGRGGRLSGGQWALSSNELCAGRGSHRGSGVVQSQVCQLISGAKKNERLSLLVEERG